MPGGPTGAPVRPGLPPRDTSAAAATPTWTARLRGRVVSADNGSALRRAQITVTASDGSVRRLTTTDAEGVWQLAELPAGRYTVSPLKGGYVTLQYGQRR